MASRKAARAGRVENCIVTRLEDSIFCFGYHLQWRKGAVGMSNWFELDPAAGSGILMSVEDVDMPIG